MSEPSNVDLRGTQGAVVIPAGTVIQNYEAAHGLTLEERMIVQEQQTAALRDDVGKMMQAQSNQDAQRLMFERTLKDSLNEAKNEILTEVGKLRNSAAQLPRARRQVFVLAWLFLLFPVPMFYSNVRELLYIHWGSALVVTVLLYSCSALVFGYLFGMFDNQ